MQKKSKNKEALVRKLVIPANKHNVAFPPPVINTQAQKEAVDVMSTGTDSEGDNTLDYSVIPFPPFS